MQPETFNMGEENEPCLTEISSINKQKGGHLDSQN
jgi:hypothetical protein